jgi:hypothetical protein
MIAAPDRRGKTSATAWPGILGVSLFWERLRVTTIPMLLLFNGGLRRVGGIENQSSGGW